MMKHTLFVLLAFLMIGMIYQAVTRKGGGFERKRYNWAQLQLSVERPEGWAERLLWSDQELEQFLIALKKGDQQAVRRLEKSPLLMIVKYGFQFQGFTPRFEIHLTRRNKEEVMKLLKERYPDQFQVVIAPKKHTLGGLSGNYFRVQYRIQENSAFSENESKYRSVDIIREILMIPGKNYTIQIDLSVRADGGNGSLEELYKILNTLKLK